jgi:hypothetical protein
MTGRHGIVPQVHLDIQHPTKFTPSTLTRRLRVLHELTPEPLLDDAAILYHIHKFLVVDLRKVILCFLQDFIASNTFGRNGSGQRRWTCRIQRVPTRK